MSTELGRLDQTDKRDKNMKYEVREKFENSDTYITIGEADTALDAMKCVNDRLKLYLQSGQYASGTIDGLTPIDNMKHDESLTVGVVRSTKWGYRHIIYIFCTQSEPTTEELLNEAIQLLKSLYGEYGHDDIAEFLKKTDNL